nr:MAG TPA_asm: hypothetical protein [Bacteriophage sp.]
MERKRMVSYKYRAIKLIMQLMIYSIILVELAEMLH